ncbi:hypothetical protein L2E82_12800 [Cichorium intybus]|uniref:Uncharacterized protein n=1 Tax=Cichorium intybus TaxID=13427 RepID=A0ACB9GH34_CICIN|nr:hypothetical protein L2E82_12800 [Cichorium intybus]
MESACVDNTRLLEATDKYIQRQPKVPLLLGGAFCACAWHFFYNSELLEERWLRASKPQGIRSKMKKSVDDSLLQLDRIPDILGIDEAHCTNERDPEGWHVQVFRSIDSNSVKGFPKDPKDATSKL